MNFLRVLLMVSETAFCFSFGVSADPLSKAAEESPSSWGKGGCYVNSSYLCTYPKDGKSCSKRFYDYLSVNSSASGYRVSLYSVQANQNVCAFSIDMSLVGGALVRETSSGVISLTREDKALRFDSKGVDPTALGLGFCGVHADIDGLEFPLSGRIGPSSKCVSKFSSVEGRGSQ